MLGALPVDVLLVLVWFKLFVFQSPVPVSVQMSSSIDSLPVEAQCRCQCARPEQMIPLIGADDPVYQVC
jgi:hypothetical protein